jgi:hypothetical protein
MLNKENLGGSTQEAVAPEARAEAATLTICRGCSWRGSRGGFRGPSHRGIVLRGIMRAVANPDQRTRA